MDLAENLPWPLPERTDLRDRLAAAYSSGRGYHDLRHLAEVLARIEELGEGSDPVLVLAAWFHDAVYDTGGDNEERSAGLAVATLSGHLDRDDVDEVARLVRMTEHHRPAAGDHRGEVLSDADLGILAASPARYAEYVADVRKEYAEIPEADFARGRLAVLEALAVKPSLFHTAYARERWEPAARRNLEAEIAELRRSVSVPD